MLLKLSYTNEEFVLLVDIEGVIIVDGYEERMYIRFNRSTYI